MQTMLLTLTTKNLEVVMFFILYSRSINWYSKKQAYLVDRTNYLEYIAFFMAPKEIIWYSCILKDLSFLKQQSTIF